jgi:hypothetical protein
VDVSFPSFCAKAISTSSAGGRLKCTFLEVVGLRKARGEVWVARSRSCINIWVYNLKIVCTKLLKTDLKKPIKSPLFLITIGCITKTDVYLDVDLSKVGGKLVLFLGL